MFCVSFNNLTVLTSLAVLMESTLSHSVNQKSEATMAAMDVQ
jgi:hypothetical protein